MNRKTYVLWLVIVFSTATITFSQIPPLQVPIPGPVATASNNKIDPAFEKEINSLPNLTTYAERSVVYKKIHDALQKTKCARIGFFGAASIVTNNFDWDATLSAIPIINLTTTQKTAKTFLDELSKELAAENAKYAIELLKTERLSNLSKHDEIDNELVKREQELAKAKLDRLDSAKRKEVVDSINGTTNAFLTRWVATLVFSSVSATNDVRKNKRTRLKNPNAEYDYGDIDDRKDVGKILAANYRGKPDASCK
jgi:hypothetical protein